MKLCIEKGGVLGWTPSNIKYSTTLSDDLEEAGKGPVATQLWNIQIREEDRTIATRIK